MTVNVLTNYTRAMAPAFSDLEKIQVGTLFLTLFASGATIIDPDSAVVDIDIERGNKHVSAYIARGTDAKNLSENRTLVGKYTSDSFEYPLIEELGVITSAMVLKRLPGESMRNPLTKMERQMAYAIKLHNEGLKKIIRKAEYSAAESFRTGAQTVHQSAAYSFHRRSTHNASASVVWSTTATAVPITDLETACGLIYLDGLATPTDAIFSDQSWREFLATTQVSNLADKRRINHFSTDMTAVAPAGYEAWIAAGALYQGQVKAGNWVLNLWTYPAVWVTDAGVSTQYLPDEEVLVMAKSARFDRYFGPSDNLETQSPNFYLENFGLGAIDGMPMEIMNAGIFQSNMFYLDAFAQGNGKALTVRTQCAPIFPTTQTDAIVKIAT